VLLGRRQSRIAGCAEEIRAAGGSAAAQSLDVTDRGAVEKAIRWVADTLGRIDILVNSAAAHSPRRSYWNVTPTDWERIISTNLTGVFNCVQATMPVMRHQGGGLVVSISSVAGLRATVKGGVAYCASKHGVVAVTQLVNLEGAEFGIRGTTICPGDVDTPMMETRPVVPPPEARAKLLKAEDVAAAVVFVATLPPYVVVEDLVITPLNR
jgi:NADP-dependent 3-hydroxy acid dehydrogenase YdfG